MIDQQSFRSHILAYFGATSAQVEELLIYNQNVFNRNTSTHTIQFPLPPEAHVSAWEEYAVAAKVEGTFEALKRVLVQLRFPIVEGISQSEAYQAATRRGVAVDGMTEATGRLQNYRGQPPLSDKAFKILQALVKAAVENLQCFHADYPKYLTGANMQALTLMCLTHLTLEELASQKAKFRIQQILGKLQTVILV